MRQQQALETERARIARDIHDQVGASLTQLALLGEMAEADKDSPEETAAHARQISPGLARNLPRPGRNRLDGQPLQRHPGRVLSIIFASRRRNTSAWPACATAWTCRRNCRPPPSPPRRATTSSSPPARPWPTSSNTPAPRRPACACAWIRDAFTLEIEDNGRGPAGLKEKAAESRNGLRNMRKRMEDIGGGFSIGAGDRGGTLVRLTVPLARN